MPAVASIVALANEAESPALRTKVDALWAKMLDSMRQALRLQPRAPLWRHRLSSRLAFELSSRQFGANADRYSAYYDDAGIRSLVDLQAAPHCARCVAGKLRQLLAYLLHLTADSELKEADAGDAASFNAHIRSRMAMQMRRGHQTFFWPQAYFTPFCDVVLRFESLKRDFDGLMAKIGCPLRLPEQRKKARGNRLLPLLADDVVASVRRMYADDYSLVKRLAGLGLDELLANATSA